VSPVCGALERFLQPPDKSTCGVMIGIPGKFCGIMSKDRVPFSNRSDLTEPSPDEGAFRMGSFLAKSILGLVPAGGTAGEFISLFVVDPTTKRLAAFTSALAGDLDDLHDRKLLTEADLKGEGEASALFLQAIQIAARSEGKAKLDALRQVAVNGACHRPDERHLSAMVLGILDRMTDPHVTLLTEIQRKAGSAFRLKRGIALETGVVLHENDRALVDPRKVTLPGGRVRYYEAREVTVNEIIVADLVNLGILADHLEMPGHVSEWSATDPSKNGTDYLLITNTGRLVLQEMTRKDEPG
jgi:hypothetical protein